MNGKTFWTWMFFFTLSATLLIPSLIPLVTPRSSSGITPSPAAYTLPYTPIVDTDESPVGNLTITNASFISGLYNNNGNQTFQWDNGTFTQAISYATQDSVTGSPHSRSGYISITWDENVEVWKSDPISNPWFNYSSRIRSAQLVSVKYNNSIGWGTLVTAPSSYYTYGFVPIYNSNFVNLSLSAVNPAWNDNVTNGTVLTRITYSYQIRISQWQVLENATNTMLPNITNSIIQTYYETFTVDDNQLFDGYPYYTGTALLTVNMSYIPFYKTGVNFDSLWVRNFDTETTYHQLTGNKFSISAANNITRMIANGSTSFQIFFKANFTIQFDQPVNPPDVYAVDRLANGIYEREHWYYVKVTGGPSLLRIANLVFNDTNVAFRDTIGTSTYFGRPLAKSENNVTITVDEHTNQINNGTTLTGGYFVSGETDVLMLSYLATSNLTVLLTDQILTPVVGASVTLFRDGIRYGSYISLTNKSTQPPKITDDRGIVVFPNLPTYGNYSIQVELAGINYETYYVDVLKTPNIVTTTIPHFPTWIILWSSFCAIITIFGYARYKQYKNVPVDETR